MKLYYFPYSPPSRKVLAVARHLGADVEVQVIDLTKGEQGSETYRAIHPGGKVPALVDGDTKIWESDAIARYLAARAGDTPTYPADPAARARVDQWSFWFSNSLARGFGILLSERLVKPFFGGGDPDPALCAQGEDLVKTYGPLLEKHLGGKAWVCGDDLTLADFSILAPMMYHQQAAFPLDDFPNLRRIYAQLEALPCWKDTAPPPMEA